MRARLIGLVLAFSIISAASGLAEPPPAAQAPAQPPVVPSSAPAPVSDGLTDTERAARLQASLAWSARFRGVVNDLIALLQNLPDAPDPAMNNAQRHVWAESSRTWAANTRASIAALRVRWQQLPPPPATVTPGLQEANARARDQLPAVFDATNALADAQDDVATQFEQRHDEVLARSRASAVSAVILTMTLFRETNRGEAAAIPPSQPQHFLLDSFAKSYDGFLAVMDFKREIMLRQPVNREAAAVEVSAAADGMRADATVGRAAIVSLKDTLAVEARTNAGTAALLPRLAVILDTYGPSFDREVAMAGELDAMAAILRDPRDFGPLEPDFDTHMSKFGDMDSARVPDANNRAAQFQQLAQ